MLLNPTDKLMQRFSSKNIFSLLVLVILLASAHNSVAYQDLSTKIVTAYANDSGSLLIRTEVTHGSPGGWLLVGNANDINARMLYSNALIAKTTNRSCWIRINPQTTGYWTVEIISIS